jgi:hypothetical protein
VAQYRAVADTSLARIPISRPLLNHFVAKALAGRGTPVRALDIRPHDDDRFDAIVTVTWPFVPAITIAFTIEQQPRFPESPVLVMRWSFLGGLGAIASRLMSSLTLPDGIRLDGEYLLLNIPLLAAHSPAGSMLGYVAQLELHTREGQMIIDAELAVPA